MSRHRSPDQDLGSVLFLVLLLPSLHTRVTSLHALRLYDAGCVRVQLTHEVVLVSKHGVLLPLLQLVHVGMQARPQDWRLIGVQGLLNARMPLLLV